MRTEDVKTKLKEQGKLGLFSEDRLKVVKYVMEYAKTKDPVLKKYLSIDPLNEAKWCADHLIKLVEGGHIA